MGDIAPGQQPGLQRQLSEAEGAIDFHLDGPGGPKEALQAAIHAVSLLMKARAQADLDPGEKRRLTAKAREIMSRAEAIKKKILEQTEAAMASVTLDDRPIQPSAAPVATTPSHQILKVPKCKRPLTVKDKTILLKSSRLSGLAFPPWEADPLPSEFNTPNMYSDPNGMLQLSDTQKRMLDSWKRPSEIHANGPTMMPQNNPIDLAQDAVTDCSIVASMCAALSRHEKGHQKIGADVIYPQKDGIPEISPNGKYMIKLYFNGCHRKVVVDDYLPISNNARALHVVCRANPNLLWPALVEKAYLKVMGGYDFPGSNSGTDLLALTGWIPEHVFLQSDDVVPTSLWKRIFRAWGYGDVLITLGTGRMTEYEEEELGLASEHDYAVLDLKEIDGRMLVLVKNPWSEGSTWKGGLGHLDSDSDEDDRDVDNIDSDDDGEPEEYEEWDEETMAVPPTGPGQFWIDLDNVCRHFANIYLNWNPALFFFRYDRHFTWEPDTHNLECKSSFSSHPQFSVENPSETKSATVWLLLQRHIQGKLIAVGGPEAGYISLYVFAAGGQRVHLSDGALIRGPYVDSSQTLLRLDKVPPKTKYTVVVSPQSLTTNFPSHSFTLSTFSDYPLKIGPATDPNEFQASVRHAWLPHTAGGNIQSPIYPTNPQFTLRLGQPLVPNSNSSTPSTTKVLLLLEARDELSVHVNLVWGGGKRVVTIRARDVIAESGEYRRGCALAEAKEIPCPGVYTIVVSTFEKGQVGEFKLKAWGGVEMDLKVIKSEEAGKLTRTLTGTWPSRATNTLAFPLRLQRLTRLSIVARSTSTSTSTNPQIPIRVSLISRSPPQHNFQQLGGYPPIYPAQPTKILASSGRGFSDLPQGVRTGDVDVEGNVATGAGYGYGSGYYGAGGGGRQACEYSILLERAGREEEDGDWEGSGAQEGYEVLILADGVVEVGEGVRW
ncbi:hypothetical protein DFH27DRAFT_509806 [Peziza echinospora]|nr:hypothetical protein DFH27DRAFT_509806 [Peziza echinospora]